MRATKRATATWRFVLPEDRELEEKERTTFILSPLKQGERMDVWDSLKTVDEDGDGNRRIRSHSYRQSLELCISHIEDVENFPAGAPKAWPRNGSDEEKAQYLDELKDVAVLVIGTEIRGHSILEEEAKN